MYPVSARWDNAIRVSHEVVSRVEVWRAGAFTGQTLQVLSGAVRLDEKSKMRRALQGFTVADVDLMPDDVEDALSPTSTDLKVFSGLRYSEGDTELVPVGVFRIETPSRDSLLGALRIEAGDYSGVLARARFVKPWNVPKGALVVAQITSMVLDVLPWVEVVDLTGSRATHPGGVFERERWDSIENLATSIGADVAFDPDGRCIIQPVPTLDTEADWLVDADSETAVLLDAGLSLSVEGVYNAVTATSSDAGTAPVSATVYQSTGPLAYVAGFKQPRFYSSPVLKTTAQCVSAARSILARSLAYAQKIAPVAAPNPALDVGDTLAVALPGRDPVMRLLSGATIPLTADAMPLDVRTEADAIVLDEGA